MTTYEHYSTGTRVAELKRFQAEVRSADPKSDQSFQQILRYARELLEMSDQVIGDALSVSRPTINRWANGKNLPYNAMRKPVLSWIDGELSKKIRLVENAARSASASSASPAVERYPMAARHR